MLNKKNLLLVFILEQPFSHCILLLSSSSFTSLWSLRTRSNLSLYSLNSFAKCIQTYLSVIFSVHMGSPIQRHRTVHHTVATSAGLDLAFSLPSPSPVLPYRDPFGHVQTHLLHSNTYQCLLVSSNNDKNLWVSIKRHVFWSS